VYATGEKWKEQRSFTLHVLRDFGFGRTLMEEKILNQTKQLLTTLEELLGSNEVELVDLNQPIQLCVGNIISDVIFGYSFHKNDERLATINHVMDEVWLS